MSHWAEGGRPLGCVDCGYIFVFLQLPYHLHTRLATGTIAGARTQEPNDTTKRRCTLHAIIKKVGDAFLLICNSNKWCTWVIILEVYGGRKQQEACSCTSQRHADSFSTTRALFMGQTFILHIADWQVRSIYPVCVGHLEDYSMQCEPAIN